MPIASLQNAIIIIGDAQMQYMLKEIEPMNRTEHIGVMLTPEQHEKLEEAKARRRGKIASKSAIVSDIIDYFFALSDAEVQQILNLRSNGN